MTTAEFPASTRWCTVTLVACPLNGVEGERREVCKACGYARRAPGVGVCGCQAGGETRQVVGPHVL